MERAVGTRIRTGDRLLLRTDHNNAYDGGSDKWMKASPYLTIGATEWCISLKNLDRITKDRVTLIGLPLHIIGAEASPVRAVVLT